MITNYKNRKLISILQAFLIGFACTVEFHKPLVQSDYEEKIDYMLAEAAELLGTYNFLTVLIFVLAFVFLQYVKRSECKVYQPSVLLPAFFSFCNSDNAAA